MMISTGQFIDPKRIRENPSISDAIEALRKAPESPTRIYASVAASRNLKGFQACTDFQVSKSQDPLRTLVNRGEFKAGRRVIAPGQDHWCLFNRNGRPALFLSQPYGPLSSDFFRETISFCDLYSLDFRVDIESVYFPGAAFSVWYWRSEEAENSPPVFSI